ncbi:hypothetical protein CYLTODRAFT_381352 [Cylindrobasidium torrendii FP15055 ss-10]|uniref:G-patch domain-containing protein n=1 Tax=Cylindrobasidium torrendii FP15055 ss-10 TaxID=1314674 RepID=A0A0D7B1P6_9AGAR|nr:hypothetical protein CYLTODRAFT_381352 [Cylindrobasidium torrendii FP15055 ss-10]
MNTGRLKRKLDNLGVDTHSRKANESFCLVGTPLPPLEKSKDTGEFVPLWKQDVRDEQGRRRLHGAFTGGFSAGYYNTVGSKEGWTPSTFVSSRNDRAKAQAARPEDYMDAEDMQDIREGRSVVDNTDEMQFGSNIMQSTGQDDESLASVLRATTLPAAQDSAGARILKKMGWKLGQGIGPRVTLRQRKLQDKQAFVSGRVAAGDLLTGEDDSVDDEAAKHKYPPRDTPVVVFRRKENAHGVGYLPGTRLDEEGRKQGNAPKGPTISAGFGLGAVNEADDDDVDIYDSGGMKTSGNRVAYEFGEEEKVVLGPGQIQSSPHVKGGNAQGPTQQRIFNDGKPIVAGFVPSDRPALDERWFPLPEVPQGWTPDPKRVWASSATKENVQATGVGLKDVAPSGMSHAEWKRTQKSADERGALLGETPLPAAKRSVFDFLSSKDRERIQKVAKDGVARPAAVGETPAHAPAPELPPSMGLPGSYTIPRLESHVASAALRGFQPFTSNPDKQARYTAYLKNQVDPDESPLLVGRMVTEAMRKEMEEFVKSAEIFKPMSVAMAGRFTTARVVENGPKIFEGLHQPSAEEIQAKEDEEQQKKVGEEKELSPKAHAAKVGMFGMLTREKSVWLPAKLLCKRFGVKPPNPEAEEDTRPPGTGADKYEADVDDSVDTGNGGATDPYASFFPPAGSTTANDGPGKRDLGNVGLGEDERQGADTLTYEKPSMDVFKAIFASDDEDSDDESDMDSKEGIPGPQDNEKAVIAPKQTPISKPVFPSDGPVDVKTFKPTFIPRGEKDDGVEKKRDKKRKRDLEKTLVSFGDEEEGGEGLSVQPMKKRRKNKSDKKSRSRGADEDSTDIWVEKPPPDVVVKDMATQPSASAETVGPLAKEGGIRKGRMRAVDYM